MWGSDYPHDEGTYPFSREALRQVFSDWSPADMQRILTDNVAKLYDFDVKALKPLADEFGPTQSESRSRWSNCPRTLARYLTSTLP